MASNSRIRLEGRGVVKQTGLEGGVKQTGLEERG